MLDRIFPSVLPFLKEISTKKFNFDDKNNSFLDVTSFKEFNDFNLNFKTIANFPVNLRLDPNSDFSFDNYEYMWESKHSESSKIKEIFSDFWNFRRKTMIIDFVKMSKRALVPTSDLVNFISSKKPIIRFTHCDNYSSFNLSSKFSLEAVNLEICNPCWFDKPLINVFSQFQNLYELSLYISVTTKKGVIEEFLYSMLSRSKNVKILKMKAITKSIDFTPGSLKNLYVLEMDFPYYKRDPAHYLEERPSENYLVSLKILGNCKSKENLNFLQKFQYLTKLTYDPHHDHKISKSALFRSRLVISGWNLKTNLIFLFRKEIIEEILMKLDY